MPNLNEKQYLYERLRSLWLGRNKKDWSAEIMKADLIKFIAELKQEFPTMPDWFILHSSSEFIFIAMKIILYRSRHLTDKVIEDQTDWNKYKEDIEDEEEVERHLSILTPQQKTTKWVSDLIQDQNVISISDKLFGTTKQSINITIKPKTIVKPNKKIDMSYFKKALQIPEYDILDVLKSIKHDKPTTYEESINKYPQYDWLMIFNAFLNLSIQGKVILTQNKVMLYDQTTGWIKEYYVDEKPIEVGQVKLFNFTVEYINLKIPKGYQCVFNSVPIYLTVPKKEN